MVAIIFLALGCIFFAIGCCTHSRILWVFFYTLALACLMGYASLINS